MLDQRTTISARLKSKKVNEIAGRAKQFYRRKADWQRLEGGSVARDGGWLQVMLANVCLGGECSPDPAR